MRLRLSVPHGTAGSDRACGCRLVNGFPLEWNHWEINEWPAKIDEAAAVSGKPVWVLEVGASSYGAEEVAAFSC